MIGIYAGLFLFLFGFITTFFINRNVKVPISGDFWDMPVKIKIGIFALIIGILTICGSTVLVLLTDPVYMLQTK